MNWFMKLSTGVKIAMGVGLLILIIFLSDTLTGWVSKARSYFYHKDEQATMQKVDQMQKEVDKIKIERDELINKAIEKDAEIAASKEKEKATVAQDKIIDEKLDAVLEEFNRETAITNTDVDPFVRCQRTRAKLIAKNIKSANDINCEEYRR